MVHGWCNDLRVQLARATPPRVAFGNGFEELQSWQEGPGTRRGRSPALIQLLCPHTQRASVLPYTGPLSGGNSVRTTPPRTGFRLAGFRRARGANTQFGGSQSPRRGRERSRERKRQSPRADVGAEQKRPKPGPLRRCRRHARYSPSAGLAAIAAERFERECASACVAAAGEDRERDGRRAEMP